MSKRKQHLPEFKAKVALKGKQTVAELATRSAGAESNLYQRPDQLTVIQFLLVIEVIRSGSFAKKFQASWHLLRMSP